MKRFLILLGLMLVSFPIATFAPEARPKIVGLYSVIIKASSLDKTTEFYGETLRLPRDTQCVVPGSKCFRTSLWQRIEIVEGNASPSGSMIEAVAFQTNNARALRSYLTASGLSPTKIRTNICGSYESFEITDPESRRMIFISTHFGVAGTVHPAEISNRTIHTGFVVNDRASTDHFYKDILGFRPYWHGGMKDDKDDWVAMQVPDGTDWIEYMLNISPNADHHTLGVMNHIALGVSDIHATEKQLIANGWKPTDEPKLGRDGKWQLNLYDPDDTRTEFMEFKPKEAPCCSAFTGPHPEPK